MQNGIEALFTTFWKSRQDIRKQMVGYALSTLKEETTDAESIANCICKEYKIKNFPKSIVIDIVEAEFSTNIDTRDGGKWKFKDLPKINVDSRLEKIIKKFQYKYQDAINPVLPKKEIIENILLILIDTLADEIIMKTDAVEITETFRKKNLSLSFRLTGKHNLQKKGHENPNELIDIFQDFWKRNDRDLRSYLIDYTASILRISSLSNFDLTNQKFDSFEDIIILLDGNIIFSLCLDTNPYHILASSAIENSIKNNLNVQIIDESWGEFRNNLRFWDTRQKEFIGWSDNNYYDNEIIQDFSNSIMKWEDYKNNIKHKNKLLKKMGITFIPMTDLYDVPSDIEDTFYEKMERSYKDPNSASYKHDLYITNYFISCSKIKKCWFISRHYRMIDFINNLTKSSNCGSIHLKQFHGWLVEFLSITIPKESWQKTAKSLLEKTIVDEQFNSPETVATLISALIHWKNEPKQLLTIIEKMPQYNSILKAWRNGDIEKVEESVFEMLDEGLIDKLSENVTEIDDYKKRFKAMRIKFNNENLERTRRSMIQHIRTTIDLLSDQKVPTHIKEIESKIDATNIDNIITMTKKLIDFIKTIKPETSKRLDEDLNLLIKCYKRIKDEN